MQKLTVVLVTALFMTACSSESHTYKGTMTRTDVAQTKSEVSITISKTSDTDGTMVVKGDGSTIFEKCTYPIKLKKTSEGWDPTDCFLKSDPGASDSRTIGGAIEIKDKTMNWNGSSYNTLDHSTERYEFSGTER